MMNKAWMILLLLTAPAQAAFIPVDAHAWMLENESAGYFKHAGGTGGQGGRVVYVTNLNNSGPGSLRSFAVQGNAIILFEDGVNGQINLTEEIKVRSKTTIWGRHRDGTGADIFVHPASNIAAAFKVVKDRGNIIIANLKGDAPGPDDSAPDFITIRGPGGPVWVHHVTVDGGCGPLGSNCNDMDGAVDVKRGGVTLSYNRVENWDNVHLILPYITGDPETESLIAKVTIHRNLFRNNNGRMPSVSGAGSRAHAYNNWIDAFRGHGMQGIDGGQVRAENNIFSSGPDEDDDAIRGDWAGDGNVFEGVAAAQNSPVAGIFTPPYEYTLEPIGTEVERIAFKNYLEAETGWQDFAEFAIPEPASWLLLVIGFLLSTNLLRSQRRTK